MKIIHFFLFFLSYFVFCEEENGFYNPNINNQMKTNNNTTFPERTPPMER